MAERTTITRRCLLQCGLAAAIARPLWAALRREPLDEADDVLAKAVDDGLVQTAVLHVKQRDISFTRHYGQAGADDAMFLLGSISKPICVTALMTLFDRGEFQLDDPLTKFIPKFTGDGRDRITLRQLLSHVSGLSPSHSPYTSGTCGAWCLRTQQVTPSTDGRILSMECCSLNTEAAK